MNKTNENQNKLINKLFKRFGSNTQFSIYKNQFKNFSEITEGLLLNKKKKKDDEEYDHIQFIYYLNQLFLIKKDEKEINVTILLDNSVKINFNLVYIW